MTDKLRTAVQAVIEAYDGSLEQDTHSNLAPYIKALYDAYSESRPPFHPIQLFNSGDGSYASNDFSVSFKDGEIVSVSKDFAKVSQGFGLADYETLKQERDKYRQALEDLSNVPRHALEAQSPVSILEYADMIIKEALK